MNEAQIENMLRGRAMERIAVPGERDAAVLIPLVEKAGETCILFEIRNASIAQGGEICFPGGQIEPDELPEKAAVRETIEELALAETQVSVMAPLFEMTGPGGRRVSAFLGEVKNYRDTWSASEVERIFLLPIDELLACEPLTHDDWMVTVTDDDFPYELIPGGREYPFRKIPRRFYFYKTKYGVIWGLTAELLYRFLELLRQQGGE